MWSAGRPCKKWGERPAAYVELREGARVTAEGLLEHCKPLLAKFKLPSHVEFKTLPKTVTGKIQKFQLRAEAKRAAELEELEAAAPAQDTSGWWQVLAQRCPS